MLGIILVTIQYYIIIKLSELFMRRLLKLILLL